MITIKQQFDKDKIVIGVSGGMDSMVLLDLLQNENIVVAHINHNLRKQSKKEQAYLENYCKERSIPFETITFTYTNFELKQNFQDLAHKKRTDFFEDVLKNHNSSTLLLAHHGDDLIETILMNIARGSSLKGYAGFREVSDNGSYKIVRPLLKYSKDDIYEYAKENKIKFFIDKSNKQDKYTRNRYRKYILPFLKRENKNIHQKYLKFSKSLFNANTLINRESKKFFEDDFSISKFNNLEYSVQEDVVSTLLKEKNINVSKRIIDSIINILSSNLPNQEVTLNDNYIFVKEYDKISIREKKVTPSYEVIINDFGEYKIPYEYKIIISKSESINSITYMKLCYNNTVFPITVRNRKPGDKMKLSFGTKKVKDILIDMKIPLSKRDEIPIVSTNNRIIWIIDYKRAETNGDKTVYLHLVERN